MSKGALGLGAMALPTIVSQANQANWSSESLTKVAVQSARTYQYYYINWAAYDLLSDDKPLTEALAMQQLETLKQMMAKGFVCDGYIMDCFWYEPSGRYRVWNKTGFPSGPDKWLAACKAAGIKPGIWLSTNVAKINYTQVITTPDAIWKKSLSRSGLAYYLIDGPYLADLVLAMQGLYDQGFRIFKFDFADFRAATPAIERKYLLRDIVRLSEQAFFDALKAFKQRNPAAEFLAYNGFGGDQSSTSKPIVKVVDAKWLEVIDAMYCGDPRPGDVPQSDIWKSKDLYSCHMVRQYHDNDIPLDRIDNTAFMIGNTGTCYKRGKAGWLRMWILSLARGAAIQTFYGDLTLLDALEMQQMADVQRMFAAYRKSGQTSLIGEAPGLGGVHGYKLMAGNSTIYVLVNPGQTTQNMNLAGKWQVVYSDYISPQSLEDKIVLHPEQMIWIVNGAKPKLNLRVEGQPNPPTKPSLVHNFLPKIVDGVGTETVVLDRDYTVLRCWFSLAKSDGSAFRLSGGAPPNGKLVTDLLQIQILDAAGMEVKVQNTYQKAIWSGLSYMFVFSQETIKAGSYTIQFRVKTAEAGYLVKGGLMLG